MIFILISWIKKNKIKFVIMDSIIMAVNLFILNIFHNGFFISSDIIISLIVANILYSFIFFISKVWINITAKYSFFFIQIDNIGEKLSYYGALLFVIINLLFTSLLWIHENFPNEKEIIIYFAMPWLIITFVNIYDSINKKRQIQ